MPLDQKAIVRQIDDVLIKTHNVAGAEHISQALSMILSAIRRLAPPRSVYAKTVHGHEANLTKGVVQLSLALEPARGMLQALKNDYESGYLQSVVELVHADIFADFLDMADYLIQNDFKDAAAVIAGSVLEEHLRKLCDKHGIGILRPDGSPKNADTLNSELAAAGAYTKLNQKNVTAWQDLRNKAAHGHYSEYTKEEADLMIKGVRIFSAQYPA
jgi:hypothetical protein